jgi:two-component system chemotaxis response regulator CheY
MRILIAEDSAAPRLMLQRALDGLGHQCVVAVDGIDAWERFCESEIDVVISDWMMPGMDGDELCRKVRSQTWARYPYFIMLTSLHDRDSVVQAMQAGVDDYLTKPFELDELRARLIAAERVTTLHGRLATQQSELERLNSALYDDARRDHLTGLGNRLRLGEDLATMADAAARYGHRFSVALFDIDRFKAFNDTFGHLAGDEMLQSVATVLVRQSRRGDGVYRYGGEELLVLLLEQDLDGARMAAERMRAAIQRMSIPQAGTSRARRVTVSAGVARLEPGDASDVTRLLARADEALYRAKQGGRNRVVVGHSGATGAATDDPAGDADPLDHGRLLLVEDDLAQARMIEGMLNTSGRSGEVIHVETLGEAKRFLRESRAACVLLDLMLPDASALDGLVELRNVAPEAPIVVVTADADEARAVKAVQAGAQDYLIKARMTGDQLRRSVLYAIQRQRGELLLAHRALHDDLTGLPNRTLFLDRLTLELAQSERRSTSVAVLFLDLNGFKSVNDRFGHDAGDQLLRALAGRLLSSMRPGDTVARHSGDEFTILGTEIAHADDALSIAQRVTETINAPLAMQNDEVRLSASIGIALAHGLGRKAEDVIRTADEAMYVAKREGKAVYLLDEQAPVKPARC